MADYIYLLENRLSQAQRAALLAVRQVARTKGLTVFLVGGAVRDMTSGSPVRDLDVAVQGNALKLKKDIEKAGGEIAGENEVFQAVFVRFPGGVRLEIGSTLSVSYPKPGKPVVKPATILDDLRRRDFTANAMALSLNDGSYGLLMDPLNGVADIENRELRLVSNYGFIEDPVRMIRAARLMARLGWQMDEKTLGRYETGKTEGYIEAMDAFHRGYETEEIFHEEDPLRVLKRLEAEGWMKHLFPALSSAKVNAAELDRLRESQMQLVMQGINPETATANFPFLTSKLAPKDLTALKKSFPRQGFVGDCRSRR
jgi:tRNA nucleotidyltransferase (CCA-adding enzyme)